MQCNEAHSDKMLGAHPLMSVSTCFQLHSYANVLNDAGEDQTITKCKQRKICLLE